MSLAAVSRAAGEQNNGERELTTPERAIERRATEGRKGRAERRCGSGISSRTRRVRVSGAMAVLSEGAVRALRPY